MGTQVKPQDKLPTESLNSGAYRGKWAKKMDFLLACIGFSVGLGNVWRFPYLCYKNGGGAFLISYFISVFCGGIPCFFLEVVMGQFMSRGGIEVWNICPLFKGVGAAAAFVVFCLNCYYCIILAWAFYFLFSSFTSVLPWATCSNWWNTEHCVVGAHNTTQIDSSVEFWENNVLGLSEGFDIPGRLQWKLFLCLVLSWAVVYLCIFKGIRAAGKVLYITALSPYVIMFILMIRGVTLPGAAKGLKYYMIPDFNKLKMVDVWVDAGTQVFFSYSISLGTLTALGSYNRFHTNSFRDTLIFALINSLTSLFAGLIIFSTLGFMSLTSGMEINQVAEAGPGLAFLVYPRALAQMPIAPLWSILFFLMIILLGLDSQFVGVEGFVAAISDIFPEFLSVGYRPELFTLGVCILNLLVGISMVTQGGMYVFQIFDYYGGARSVVIIALFECIVITYVFGIKEFNAYLKDMIGFSLWYIPHVFWGFISPVFLIVVAVFSVMVYSELSYKRASRTVPYHYPSGAIIFGWIMASISIVMIPVVAIVIFARAKGTLKERWVEVLSPKYDDIHLEK